MLTVRTIDNTDTVALLSGSRPIKGQDHEGVFALVAEEQGELAGFAVARSCPKAIVFFGLEGDTKTCRLLLERLVRRAGERAVCGLGARYGGPTCGGCCAKWALLRG